ncbi:MAG: GGDEF domain-containing protein [Gammaproteobacteria bacterium]|nr:MAG: GGDEF domain-containing protein [Gammaproteobacteria bacterium]
MSETIKYTLWGVAFGLGFPIGSMLLLHFTEHLPHPSGLSGWVACIAQAHAENILLYVVDSAPIWLGLFAYLAGKRQDQNRRLASGLEREVLAKTHSLRQALAEAQQANETIVYLAEHDALTGLLNRPRFERELTRWLDHVQRYRRPAALMFVDLDYFKRVNDTQGHEAGDHYLIEFAAMLRSTFRTTDQIGRLGGDEFVVLMPDSDREQAIAAAEKLLRTLKEATIEIHGVRHAVSVSIGLALAPEHSTRADELIRCADAAMYEAKQAGRAGWRMCTQAQARRDQLPRR